MRRYTRSIILFSATAMLFSACSKMPDHAKYIPKDAIAVAGLNLKSLSKKIAWNVITGSKLFKEMQARIPQKGGKDAVNDIENSGIDVYNTFYVYVKSDVRSKGSSRITGLVPLSDAGQWEAYVKKVFPTAVITQHGDRKEASLSSSMYVAWDMHLMIMINVLNSPDDYDAPSAQPAGPVDMSAEMDNAFTIQKDNSVTTDKHFNTLAMEEHDISFWLNYDQLMSQYMTSSMAQHMNGVSLSNTLWKNAAFTVGFDFVKGRITGEMKYYIPEGLKAMGVEFGTTNVDKDMLARLPSQNMDMLMAAHISPKGVKAALDTMGLLGLANAGLSTQGLDVDHVLDAFTGDMAIQMNDFGLHVETLKDSFMGQTVVHQKQKPSMSMSYALKINKKEDFQKLVDLAKQNGLMAMTVPMSNGFAVPLDDRDSIYILINDQYVVASNKYPYAFGFLGNAYTGQKLPEAISSQFTGNPSAFYFDIQGMLKNIDPNISHSAYDSAVIVNSKKLLNNISLSGGGYKDNSFSYHLDINFMNTEENSIIDIMDYAMKINDARQAKDSLERAALKAANFSF